VSSYFINVCCFLGTYEGQFGHLQSAHQVTSANISLCICLPNFIQIGPSATEWWRHIYFSRWRPRHRNSTSGLGFRDFAHLGLLSSTCIPNFGEISQSTAEILLLSVSKTNVCHVGILVLVPIFTFASPSTCYSASAYQISSKSAILNYLKVTADHSRSANWGPRWVGLIKFRIDRIYRFGDIVILCYEFLSWNCLFTLPLLCVVWRRVRKTKAVWRNYWQ